ncbi:MAG: acyltransferase [Burkholderiales bacterium]|nr:acyltransferase [Burkholderiales bacterium]
MSFTNLYLVAAVVVASVAFAALARLLPARAAAPAAPQPQPQPPPPSASRHAALQGLRGLLAFGVFMHHSFLWSRYGRGFGWLDADVWHQFGESRVVLFFMLTATLFYGRLLDARGRGIDWLKLYVSRLLRLGPAYWLAMALMFAAIAWATVHRIDGAGSSIVQFSWSDILGQCLAWLGFSILGMPSIDGYFATPTVTAVVTWTLPYECAFYALLPLLALPLRVKLPLTALGFGLIGAIGLAVSDADPVYCVPFVGGLAVAQVMRVPRLAEVLRHRACAAAALVAMTVAILQFRSVYAPVPLLLLAFSLAVVACGNDLFGILNWRLPQALGSWAYSLYLLHGIALYTLFKLVIGDERAARLTDWQCGLLLAAFVPVVLVISWASQRWVESPPMRAVPAVVAAIRRRLPPRGAGAAATQAVGGLAAGGASNERHAA